MRVFLALLALIGLLLSPAAASAAAAGCLQMGSEVMAATVSDGASSEADQHDCCDEAGTPAKHIDQGCAQACAVMGGVGAALPEVQAGHRNFIEKLVLVAAKDQRPHDYGPPRLKRPPRLT